MLRSETKFDKEIINVLIKDQGFGDMIANIPAINYSIKNFKHTQLLIWVPDFIVDLYKNLIPGQIIRGYSEAKKKYNDQLTAIATGMWTGSHNSMKTHPVDYAFYSLLNKMPTDNSERNYPKLNLEKINITKFNLPEKYITISVGSTAPVKEFPSNTINQVIDFALKKGYTPVFLGNTKQEIGVNQKLLNVKLAQDINYNLGIDLTNKTSLLESGKIIAGSKCLIGMEGGLTHLAGCTNTHIIAGYTFADPKTLAPYRENVLGYNMSIIEPDQSLECRYCMTTSHFLYDIDYSRCFYDDYKCIETLHPAKFIFALDKIL